MELWETLLKPIKIKGGLVYRSYPFALWMFQKYWDYPIEGLFDLVNFGGDCDTTAAIYGAMVGAKHGNIFPKHLQKINNLEYVLSLGDELWKKKK